MLAAREQQHERHGAERHRDRAAKAVIHEPLGKRVDGDAPLLFPRGLERREAGAHRQHLGLRLFEGHAGPQPPQCAEPVVAAGELFRREHQGLPEAGPAAIEASGGQDADDFMGLAVEDEGAADDRRVATEAVLPDRVTQDDDRGGAALLVVRLERAAQCRLDPEDVEIVGRYQHAVQPRGLPAADQRHAQSSRGRQRLERSAEPLPVQEIERADAVARRRRRRFEHTDDAFGLGIRERPQQHGIHQAEHGSVGANANRHHPDRDGGKAAIPQQQLQPVADVTQERVDPADGALIAMRFLHRFDAAERGAWPRAGLARATGPRPGRHARPSRGGPAPRPRARARAAARSRAPSIAASSRRLTASPPGTWPPGRSPAPSSRPRPAAGACRPR